VTSKNNDRDQLSMGGLVKSMKSRNSHRLLDRGLDIPEQNQRYLALKYRFRNSHSL
jgi:hypothetical protein